MYIESTSALYRLFMWSLLYVGAFSGDNSLRYQYRYRTNLCHFVRVIAVYVPLVTAFRLFVVWLVIYATILSPIKLFGGSWYFWFWVWVAAAGGVGSGVILANNIMKHWRQDHPRQHARSTLHNVFDVVIAYARARKERICPLIEFRNVRGL